MTPKLDSKFKKNLFNKYISQTILQEIKASTEPTL